MRPKTLSASALQNYELCPARYKATNIEYTPDLSSSAADLGTAVHAALESWVKSDDYKGASLAKLKEHWKTAYNSIFTEQTRFKEGEAMLKSWFARSNLTEGRTILSTEQKKNFKLKTSAGEIPFNYICDRVDQLEDGDIEVVDYKTVSQPLQPEDLRNKLQARCYAVAMMIEHPEAKGIWVTFDLIRFDSISLYFPAEECRETYRYIKKLVEEILADDGKTERLNQDCRWCVRKGACSKLRKHMNGGGEIGIDDLNEAVQLRAELEFAMGAMKGRMENLDRFILQKAQEDDWTEMDNGDIKLEIKSRGRRTIDPRMAAPIIGPELMAECGNLTISAVDKILKDSDLEPEKKAELKSLVTQTWGAPSISVKTSSAFDKG